MGRPDNSPVRGPWAAVLGIDHTHLLFFFEIGFGVRAAKTNFKKEGGYLALVTQGGVRSELALGWDRIVPSELQLPTTNG